MFCNSTSYIRTKGVGLTTTDLVKFVNQYANRRDDKILSTSIIIENIGLLIMCTIMLRTYKLRSTWTAKSSNGAAELWGEYKAD